MYDFNQSYFDILAVPTSYELDLAQLKKHYHAALLKVHPDRFTLSSDHEKRLAVQFTAYLNEAYQTLSSPIKRAIYLLKCSGIDVDLERGGALSPSFLQLQIELREQLALAEGDVAKLADIKQAVIQLKDQDNAQLATLLTGELTAQTKTEASPLIAQLMFYDKLLTMIKVN